MRLTALAMEGSADVAGLSASGTPSDSGPDSQPDPAAHRVAAHLETILASEPFAASERMRVLLCHLVRKSLDGAAEDLKESILGMEVFGRAAGYDTKSDGIVRVEAHRLRTKLDRFYETHAPSDGLRLRLDKGSYRVRVETIASAPQPLSRKWNVRNASLWLLAGVVVAVGVWGTVLWQRAVGPRALPVLRQITADTGLTTEPSLSTDGKTIVYASDRNTQGNLLLWRQSLDGGAPAQLTEGVYDDHEPWLSPDGRSVVYRSEREGGGIYKIGIDGGVPELLAHEGRRPRFSPDGEWVLYYVSDERYAPARFYVIPSGGGQPRRLAEDFADAHTPVWAPDGKAILFCGTRVSNDPAQEHDWWVLPYPQGQAVKTGAEDTFERLSERTGERLRSRGDPMGVPLDWRTGELIFSASPAEVSTLWRIPVSDEFRVDAAPERVTYGTSMEVWASTERNRIAFASGQQQVDIYEVSADTHAGTVVGGFRRATTAPSPEMQPSLSPKGDLLAYVADRDGYRRAWMLDLRSGRERPLPPIARRTDKVVFSPDEKQIAFLAMDTSKMRIHVQNLVDGRMWLLSEDAGVPTNWSPNGRWILFEPGLEEPGIGLLDAASGAKRVLLARAGWGLRGARVSPDGKWVAFQADIGPSVRKVLVAPFRPVGAVSMYEWIDISGQSTDDFLPAWGPDGRLLYFISERNGRRSVWAQRLAEGSPRPVGQPFVVVAMNEARRTLLKNFRIGLERIGLQVGADRIVVSMDDTTSNIWLAELK